MSVREKEGQFSFNDRGEDGEVDTDDFLIARYKRSNPPIRLGLKS
jgi:hypothetical protein